MYEYKIKSIDRVVDGDTVDVTIDLGFDILHKTRVRLYGLNAPESRTRDLEEKKRGLKAKERLIELLESKYTRSGEPESLILKTKEKGKFGRYLGVFYRRRKDDPLLFNINERLITEGHAVEYFGGKR
jgi:micrococcal nuclease